MELSAPIKPPIKPRSSELMDRFVCAVYEVGYVKRKMGVKAW